MTFDLEAHEAFLHWMSLPVKDADIWIFKVLGRPYSDDMPATDLVKVQREAYRQRVKR